MLRRWRGPEIAREDSSLLGQEPGHQSEDDLTIFDSTGLAMQDLAVAAAVYERWREDPSAKVCAGVTEVTLA